MHPPAPLLECVPNLSEGRRPEVIGRLAGATRVSGVQLLDVSSDPDHNRTVLTLAGSPAGLRSSLLALYEAALETIDLRSHQGVHPRIGAVDVVPFVPLGDTSMETAVACARELAAEVAARFDLPVYLYEQAASRQERRALSAIRRGGFEGLSVKLASPAWAPDFGPAGAHPTAGATVIGARFFLIAFNALLDDADLAAARAIARAVRASGGGLPAVRSMGVWLASRGRAQVSMNLVDYRTTSLSQALARVRLEAAARGASVAECEVVGLVPQDAALEVVREALQLPRFTAGGILEQRLDRLPATCEP